MRSLSLRVFLLTLALVLGQWLSIAHSSSHAVLSADDAQCDFCLYEQGIGAGAYLPPKTSSPEFSHERPRALVVRVFKTAAPSFYAIRGPPSGLTS